MRVEPVNSSNLRFLNKGARIFLKAFVNDSFLTEEMEIMENTLLGRGLVVLGVAILFAGLVFLFAPRIPYLGRLPGDISIQSGNVKVFIPLATCIVLSLLLSFVLNLFSSRMR